MAKMDIKNENIYDRDDVKKQADAKILYRFFRYIRPYRFIFSLTILMLLITAALETAGPFILKIAIDKYLTPKNYNGFLNMVLLFALSIFLQFGVRYIQQYMTEYIFCLPCQFFFSSESGISSSI